jgi:hypothetical protein
MTPQEQHDYKLKWLPGYPVRLHSDLDVQGKTWCKRNIERHQWSFTTYTNVYEHTFYFELEEHAKLFAEQWPRFINQ